MAEELPQEALVRLFSYLPLRDRSRLSCVSQSWRSAALVDAVSLKLSDSHVPHYLHVALPDGAAQLQAAACPMMSLARSADITWASGQTTGSLLQSMPSLERLAFTSMASGSLPVGGSEGGCSESGLLSLRSLTNLQSLQLNTCDASPLLEAMPSAPRTLKELELHLTGANWQSSVLDTVATQLGEQASQLRSLVLRCSHASVYASTEPMESLSRLSSLTSLRMGPNPEDVCRHRSPLGFGRLPAFLGSLTALRTLDISMADSPAVPSLSTVSLRPLRAIRDVKLTLRADTSFRAVAHLPPSISAVTGLSSLTVQGFSFEDPGGWCTTGFFDVHALASCPRLTRLQLQLGTWECEHCEAFELLNLQALTQLQTLHVVVAASALSSGNAAAGSAAGKARSRGGGGAGAPAAVAEVLLALPALRPAHEVLISSSMRVVLRNSKVLARARTPGVLAHSIILEEPLPPKQQQQALSGVSMDTASGGRTDQAAGDTLPASPHPHPQQHYVRASAHIVISALRELWPSMEVWQYPMRLPHLAAWAHVAPELCCRSEGRDAMQARLRVLLLAAIAGPHGAADEEGEDKPGDAKQQLLHQQAPPQAQPGRSFALW